MARKDIEKIVAAAVEQAIAAVLANQSKPSLLSRKATAERLHVNYSTLWRWEKIHFLVPVHRGKYVYYRLIDIENMEAGKI